MQSTKGHAPVRDVLKAAGVNPRTPEPGMPATSTSDSYVSALRGWEAGSQNRTRKRRNTMQEFGARITGKKRSMDNGRSGAMTEIGRQSPARMSSQGEVERVDEKAKLRQQKDLRRDTMEYAGEPPNGDFCISGNSSCSPVVEEDTV